MIKLEIFKKQKEIKALFWQIYSQSDTLNLSCMLDDSNTEKAYNYAYELLLDIHECVLKIIELEEDIERLSKL